MQNCNKAWWMGGKGVVLKDHCGEDVQILGYKDAYIHLMKLELDGDLVDVKNVAHFSGGDFYASIVVDQTDGNIVLSGTTADKDICGLPDVDDCLYAVNTLIKLDADDLDMIWQQHYNAYGEGNCAFGLIQTADGGFVQVGNNELDEGETETFNIVRYTPDCQAGATFDLDGDHTLTSDETWNGSNKPDPYRIRGNVIIPNTKKLTISGITVEFAGTKNTPGNTKSGITVEGGGRLIVNDGAVLKGIDCGGEQMWDGITALGSPTSAYGGNQAVVVLTGDAVIENALRGVVLGGTAWENVESVVPPPTGSSVGTLLTNTYRDDQAYGGGRLFAAGAGFLNCARGVVWNPQPNYSNLSALYDVDFAFTGPLADPLYKPASDALGAPILAEMGCRLRSVRDITFEGCTFINSASGGLFDYQRQRPSGMYATDSKFSFVAGSADPNFELLYIGIEGNAGFGGLPATMNISGKFSQVYQGLVLRNNIAPYVSGSSFSLIPDVADSDDGDPAGIHAVGTQGITLTDNTFDSDAGYKSYGTHINNSLGNGGAKVEFNTFTDFYVANRFEKDNSSLQTHCNTYTGDVGDFSWEVRGTLANQINIANSSYFPDNKFLWTCGSPLLDITSQNALSYYERAQTLTNSGSILLCYDNQVTVIPGTGLPTSPNCTLEDPCPDPPNCSTLATQYAGNDKALTDRNDLLNAYVRMGNRAVSDSLYLPGMTRAIDLLEDRDEQEDKRILTATYAALEDYTAAETELGDVDDTDDETADFIALYTVLIDAGKDGRDAYHLNAADFEAIAELMDHNTAAAEQVRVIDHIVNGNYHPLFVEQDEARPAEREESGFQGSIPAAGILVSPNPFIKTVRFTAPTGAGIQYLTISDPHGQVLYRHTSRTGETTMTWKPEKLPQGLYFYTCRLSNGEVQNGKLAKTDQ